jgi:hypothetical protein
MNYQQEEVVQTVFSDELKVGEKDVLMKHS